VRAGPPADDGVDDVATGVRLHGNVADERVAADAARLRAEARKRSDVLLQDRGPRTARRRDRVAVEPAARRRQGIAVGEDDPADRRVLQLVAADPDERRAAERLVEHADAGVRVGAGVRLAGADPEAVRRVDRKRADRERWRVVRQWRPAAAGPLPDAAVRSAGIESRAV